MKPGGAANTSSNAPPQRLCTALSGTYTCTHLKSTVRWDYWRLYHETHSWDVLYITIGIGRIQKNATPKGTVMFHMLPPHTCTYART